MLELLLCRSSYSKRGRLVMWGFLAPSARKALHSCLSRGVFSRRRVIPWGFLALVRGFLAYFVGFSRARPGYPMGYARAIK
jgi:hypothetical protein